MIPDSKVVVLNTAEQVVSYISWHRAVMLLKEEKAYIKTAVPGVIIHSPSYSVALPRVIVLVNWVSENLTLWASEKPSIPGIFRRDGFVCAYCGGPGDTIDHILPKSRGGSKDSWNNLITACSPCNHAKDDRTPEEADMPLLFPPYDPSVRARKRMAKGKKSKRYSHQKHVA